MGFDNESPSSAYMDVAMEGCDEESNHDTNETPLISAQHIIIDPDNRIAAREEEEEGPLIMVPVVGSMVDAMDAMGMVTSLRRMGATVMLVVAYNNNNPPNNSMDHPHQQRQKGMPPPLALSPAACLSQQVHPTASGIQADLRMEMAALYEWDAICIPPGSHELQCNPYFCALLRQQQQQHVASGEGCWVGTPCAVMASIFEGSSSNSSHCHHVATTSHSSLEFSHHVATQLRMNPLRIMNHDNVARRDQRLFQGILSSSNDPAIHTTRVVPSSSSSASTAQQQLLLAGRYRELFDRVVWPVLKEMGWTKKVVNQKNESCGSGGVGVKLYYVLPVPVGETMTPFGSIGGGSSSSSSSAGLGLGLCFGPRPYLEQPHAVIRYLRSQPCVPLHIQRVLELYYETCRDFHVLSRVPENASAEMRFHILVWPHLAKAGWKMTKQQNVNRHGRHHW
eukprot:scaffold136494_cov47-Attheya_sp.AAC.3